MTQRHYELTGETKELSYVTLHRIRATRDLPQFNVKAGDEGGWIESTRNLEGNAWVGDEAWVYGHARVYGNAHVFGNSIVSDDAFVLGYAQVFGHAKIRDKATVTEHAKVYDYAKIYNNAFIFGDAEICDKAHVLNHAKVSGKAKISGDTMISGWAEIKGHALISSNNDYLCLTTFTSTSFDVTLAREKDGGHNIRMGCWYGTIDELEEVFKRKKWIETSGYEADQAREEMLTMCQLLRARIKRWG